ncbi:uncharacterized protein LOC123448283 isoform X2 [Hordeum vulgare subsp. vulgare]|uniref:uncharacterized protein LOC123448283 isoform X2 n=1 Tax=Hordeum vulgare subsp. vulgare TaxID=112509 RepID=UPI001D1A5B5B|nr:uncharacterized protein LOC123448283 isoform X2 [Hordeum vulgare subsp. vulgare]
MASDLPRSPDPPLARAPRLPRAMSSSSPPLSPRGAEKEGDTRSDGTGSGGGAVFSYGEAGYWDARYVEEGGAPYDWYQRYAALRPFVRPDMSKFFDESFDCAPIPLAHFDDTQLLFDYNLLEQTSLVRESTHRLLGDFGSNFGRNFEGRPGAKLPPSLVALRKAAERRSVRLFFLPRGMTRRARNRSRHDNRWQLARAYCEEEEDEKKLVVLIQSLWNSLYVRLCICWVLFLCTCTCRSIMLCTCKIILMCPC